MGGGLLQLVAYGAQDVYLTGNPQITFFKVVYRRHTNFAMEAIQQTFSGLPDYGNTVYCQISRNGDLIHRTYLEVGINATTDVTNGTNIGSPLQSYVNYLGLRLLKSVSIEIGGQQIDKHYSDWLYIWNELSLPRGKRYAYDSMIGADRDALNSGVYGTDGITTLFIPLEFWFCRNIGLALPLIALQYHEVKIKIEFESAANCMYKLNSTAAPVTTGIKLNNPMLWVDYIYLDTDERRKFAQLSHEYLIEQLQFTGADTVDGSTTSAKSIRMNFNHPCKELVWVIKPTAPSTGTNVAPPYWNNFTDRNRDNQYVLAKNPVLNAKIQLNGNDRFAERTGNYFSLVQPYQHHECTPNNFNSGINVYSFAIKPEEHQPSGTLNMSRIDTAVLSVTSSVSGTIYIYTVNYNVLRILSGMGGLAYSN